MLRRFKAFVLSTLRFLWCPESPSHPQMAALRDVIARGEFPTLSNTEAIHLFASSFPTELSHLRNASATVESGSSTPPGCLEGKTPSAVIYGADFAEVNRTLVSMLALKWTLADDYESFTRGQSEGKLTLETFKRMREVIIRNLHDPGDIYALLVAILIDDIGKDSALATTAEAEAEANHSELVYHAAQGDRIPALAGVPNRGREAIMRSLQIGSKLNLSQLVQGECAPASLSVLRSIDKGGCGFEMRAIVTLLDVAGAGAHRDARGCALMTESVCRAYLRTIEVVGEFIRGNIPTERACYDRILTDRAELLHKKGFALLSVENAEERTLLRLLCMGRGDSLESAEMFQAAFQILPEPTRRRLVDGLSVAGIGDGVAIVPYYAPGLLAEVLRSVYHKERSSIVAALSAFLRFLARVFDGPRPNTDGIQERDLSFVQDVIKSDRFGDDPSILDTVRLPWIDLSDTIDPRL
ncbi:hypothetical protein KXW98_003015 [Aspergillus fumigatus]|uniref:Uncharacterized protein n=3 Tax=Aspergillus fumigatus TaxID=746128 RepID=Q4WR73_ASPFU|nr:conserved hypothetical protein [Aspergillus fumigatus Af293]EDP56946.1 conserved hypothetical protein [Aspergillus fumigatus A1163]KAF4263534.1 hypothetical protein CNMCM8714_008339 [Aspergillus fumigatus]KMK55021.1 hypothetical protein Y699_09367 [Aspergillus fumigatus Z5]EAL91059.1 conserved hypothetical protein [Aspergillus fumigatus Af293]KAF4268223.1 hypothetical protein CNMCM8057_008661 [Aspergillus fumigatus]